MDEELKVCECVATEDDWLDISYSQRHYIEEEQNAISKPKRHHEHHGKRRFLRWTARAVAFLLVVGLLVAMRYVKNGIIGEVFAFAKEAYSSDILLAFEQDNMDDIIQIPINVTVDAVENGTVKISGGKVLLNFKEGEVADVTENTVTVKVDDKLKIVYSGLSKILVSVGDVLTDQAVVGKYVNSAEVNLIYDNEIVKDITTVNYTLVWKA